MDILRVAREVTEATYLIVGDGPMFDQLDREARMLDNVFLTGQLPKRKLPAVYAHSTGLLFPSIREGCPNVVLEAMASGIPVIGYEATSMPELITDGETGYLVPACDTEALADRVELLAMDGQGRTLGERARRHVEQYHTFDVIAHEYEEVYRELLDL
jgi:glycosyltransferase involved in cell wall biosynthesis